MSFDWSDYLIVAQELASQTAASSKTRSKIKANLLNVINRAYYGAFRKARNHLRDKDHQPHNTLLQGNTHQNVINLFNISSDVNRLMIAQFLRDLRAARNKADYDDTVPNLPGLTMTALLQSEQVIELLKTL